mmetsp:Transcript_20385/g.43476  ORF Transcript_20385/g.43476 Transcript_20385/m.43476 type:complete len:483 (-) Transcript_20385:359-1807(-)|eukprot:CAMPEP_0206461932 /NCGR_PEP_ID=MMETSP0324_2-20121206/25664_1 /ASSEMBLY_ACC=CAM_ASM_000836 /TAXON_ID=2866 /ORGANISM="Crypthecodinium cohnii, Strain Seligo" /LENGTH=482 /DNA_ID=CAMNT_0053933965 /DNA_START=16 /DNA_END=1464 /DNA_ORIENTATION=+
MAQGQVQQFASAPQAVSSRFRSPDETLAKMNNIMYDRRVVRGNTHASLVQTQPDAAEVRKQREAQRRRLLRANQPKKRASTPEPVAGRKHMDIQTDSYLEELTERTVEFEAETQTDFLLDRPPSPLFMPAKIGVDVDTQIEEGELFDFDVECEPILEVLVGKTLEQSMMEVLEEEELESLRRHQEDFEQRRNAELLEVQRMEAAEKRRADETERRLMQQAAQKQLDLMVMRKVVSKSVASAHLSSVMDQTLAHLFDAGIFADSVQLACDNKFMPDMLLKAIQVEVEQAAEDRNVFDDILQNTISSRLSAHEARLTTERERLAAIDSAEREARNEKEEERQARERLAEQIKLEQDALVEWEQYVPPPPPKVPEQHIKEIDAEGKAVYGEGLLATIPAEKLEELKEMLAQVQTANEARAPAEGEEELPPEQLVCGKVAPLPEGEEGMVLESFHVGTAADRIVEEPEVPAGEEGAATQAEEAVEA